MLLAAVITLHPLETGTAPAALGRAVHAWALGRIGQSDPALAGRLHDGDGPRPFTASNLWGAGRPRANQVALDPSRPCWVRLTGLTGELSAAIEGALPAPGETLTLAEVPFRVAEVATETDQHPWAGRADYEALMQQYTLDSGRRPDAVTLRFASPTAFRSHGQDLPLPLPSLVFDGLLRKWNTFASLALPEEAKRYAQECIALSRFRLRSHWVSFEAGDKGAQVGFTGEVRFRFLVKDAYWTRVMTLLAAYAFWAGTGYRTTAGLGQTQALRAETSRPP